MGVVSGIVMPFQFGTNWSRYSDATANVVAPLMAYEGLTAFFLEAAFLGVLLFGRKLVPQWAHFGGSHGGFRTLFSLLILLSTAGCRPVGYEIVDGRFVPTDWLAILFNPSFPYRFMHTVVAVYLTTAFTVIGIAAWYLRHGRFVAESRTMIAMGVGLATVLVPAQALIGDAHGLNTLAHQPQKLAAMEVIWLTGPRQPAVLFAIPDEAAEVNRMEVAIPGLASLYLTHDWDGVVRGLRISCAVSARRSRWSSTPPVMVGMWGIMFALTAWALWLAWRRLLTRAPYGVAPW
jgi:cytochrome d ubiquinol oxidase subunit I